MTACGPPDGARRRDVPLVSQRTVPPDPHSAPPFRFDRHEPAPTADAAAVCPRRLRRVARQPGRVRPRSTPHNAGSIRGGVRPDPSPAFAHPRRPLKSPGDHGASGGHVVAAAMVAAVGGVAAAGRQSPKTSGDGAARPTQVRRGSDGWRRRSLVRPCVAGPQCPPPAKQPSGYRLRCERPRRSRGCTDPRFGPPPDARPCCGGDPTGPMPLAMASRQQDLARGWPWLALVARQRRMIEFSIDELHNRP